MAFNIFVDEYGELLKNFYCHKNLQKSTQKFGKLQIPQGFNTKNFMYHAKLYCFDFGQAKFFSKNVLRQKF